MMTEQKKPTPTQKKYAKHVGKLLRRTIGHRHRIEQILELRPSYSNRWKYKVMTLWSDDNRFVSPGETRLVECAYVLHSKYYELLE